MDFSCLSLLCIDSKYRVSINVKYRGIEYQRHNGIVRTLVRAAVPKERSRQWQGEMDGRRGQQKSITGDAILSAWWQHIVAVPVSQVPGRQHLWSARCHQLSVPRVHRSTLGSRAFSVVGSTIWNSLPDHLRDPTVDSAIYAGPEDVSVVFQCCWVVWLLLPAC